MKQKIKQKTQIDIIIPIVFAISMIVPIIASLSQYYIVGYADDIVWINWAREHGTNIIDILTAKLGTGFRPMMSIWYAIGYALWGSTPMYYYLLSGLLFSGSMVFLYLLGKTLHSKSAGFIAVLTYLILDASFILVSKINFIATTGELFFLLLAIYFSIQYFKTNSKTSMWLGITMSGFAFLSKEPSLLIIPAVNLTYLFFSKTSTKKRLLINIVPFIYLSILYFFITPDIGAGNASLTERMNFYFTTEFETQFKTGILLLIVTVVSWYYMYINKLRTEILLCGAISAFGFLPLLITQQPVQPTYLAEANLGMVLLIGIIISESVKKNNIILGLVIIGILAQVTIVPGQISNMQKYNHMISDNQKTFFETVESIKTLPENEPVFYLPDATRQKYGGMQINEDFFHDYLCIRNLCNTEVTTNYSAASYIILPSTLDTQIFKQEYPNETVGVITQINHGGDYGFILKR
ncbi:MAG: glycosyltransferase family 39 protein [Pedobacter sp.]|uniref:ArnT family glycosyltransferase n=1 Tax=Pedobacter sp. TaxID=1411316 RepID=UPI003562542A